MTFPATAFARSMSAHFSSTITDASMLTGWVPALLQCVTAVLLVLAIGLPARSWWVRWVPIAAAIGVIAALWARWFAASEGMAGEPAPPMLWIWTGLVGFAIAISIVGWPRFRWWRRGVSLLAIPLCALCAVLTLNMWVGYVRTVQAAWSFITVGPLPNQVELSEVRMMAAKGQIPKKGRIVPVTIDAQASGFKHRGELVYLPPIWFTSVPPPALPVVMMIGGEFGSSADWLRAGDAAQSIDAFVTEHGGSAPILVFVDKGGAFNKDTECVNGARGNAADHLTKDVVPYINSTFGSSSSATQWGVVGWSMGGTCAIDLTVMHPELFSAFVDIAGDLSPNVGTRQQTVDRLFGGDEDAYYAFDPTTVMRRHGAYSDVSGVFAVEAPNSPAAVDQRRAAADSLCETGSANGISCSVVVYPGKHDWQFGAYAFSKTLPWLAGVLETPNVPVIALPR